MRSTRATWTLLYVPPSGGKYNGKLKITNQRLLYDAQFDVSASGMLNEALFVKWGSEGLVIIPKARIAKLEPQKSFFAMNIDPVIAAIQTR